MAPDRRRRTTSHKPDDPGRTNGAGVAVSVARDDPEEYTALSEAREMGLELDLDAMEVVSHLMRAYSLMVRDLEVNVHRPAGTTWAGFRMMFLLRSHGSMAPQEIADLLHVAPSSVSAGVKTLEGYRLVRRSRRSDDGRVVTVELTARGVEVVDELSRRNNEREIQWVAALSPEERRTLVRLVRKILVQRPDAPEHAGKRLVSAPRSRKR